MFKRSHILLIPFLTMAGLAGCDDDVGQMMTGDQPDMAVGDSPDLAATTDLSPPPPPPGIKYIDVSNPADVTPEGRFALLQDFESVSADIYVYDSYLDQLTKRGAASNPDPAMGNADAGTPVVPQGVFGMSADASRVVGTHGEPLQPSFFDATGWHDLGSLAGTAVCPNMTGNLDDQGSAGAGWDISDDGKTIVGMAWNTCSGGKAVRWTESSAGQGAYTALQSGGNTLDRATKVSADGTIAGGFFDTTTVDRSPAVWRANGNVIKLDPTGMVIGEVLAMSADGTMVAGPWNDVSNNGFYWTEAGGVKILPALSDAQPSDQVFPNAIAAGGELIFGAAGDQNGLGNPMRAWVWTAKNNRIQLLQDIVKAQGFTIPTNIVLANVIAASVDGSVVLGTTLDMDPSLPQPKQRSFLLRLPAAVYSESD